MKKTFLFLSAAVLLLAACNKTETVRTEVPDAGNPIAFKAISGTLTKGAELSGSYLAEGYGIYAAATQKSASGVIENASYFSGDEQLFKNEGDATDAATPWKAHNGTAFAPVYWPIGGDAKLDFLAYAEKTDNHSDVDGKWKVVFDYPTTDITRQFTITAVDTYANQNDFLYAAKQNQSKAENSGTGKSVNLSFEHAQALLIFNVKVNDAAAASGLKINKIMFIDDSRLQELRENAQAVQSFDASAHAAWVTARDAKYGEIDADGTIVDKDAAKATWLADNPEPAASAPVLDEIEDEQVPLLTVGTFTVNNEKVELEAAWSALSSKKDNYVMPNFVLDGDAIDAGAVVSAANSGISEKAAYTLPIASSANFAQLGETLLIPQQEKLNFVIEYVSGGNTMYYRPNNVRGIWEMGKKYIYNLDIDVAEIEITESVADYVLPVYGSEPVTL